MAKAKTPAYTMPITKLSEELDIEVNQLIKLRIAKLGNRHFTGFGVNTKLTAEGAELLRLAVESPMAVPTKLMGLVLHEARNPRWAYVKIDGKEGKWPVLIHLRDRGRIMGKRIAINSITDDRGTTYTHNVTRD